MEYPQIESYLNYREYIADAYLYKKKKNEQFSHRAFSVKAGISSPSYLKMVVDGKRNLSQKTFPKFAKGLSLNEKEKKYFEALILFNQASDNESRSSYFQELIKLRSQKTEFSSLEDNSFEFLSKWYTVSLYVLIGTEYFKDDIDWIYKKFGQKVSQSEIKKSLKLMLNLKLIKRDIDRGYAQASGALSAADDTKNIAVYNYHKQMLELAGESLNTTDQDLREFNGATISISLEDLPVLKEKIRAFRKEMNELTSSKTLAGLKGREVYQMNVQLFPLTDVEKH